jgi:sulfur-carrier protein
VIRVVLPYHLRGLARVSGEVELDLAELEAGEFARAGRPATVGDLLAALERRHPVLRGTIRDAASGARRPLVRYFACGEDLSFAAPDEPLPPAVRDGQEPFLVVGAMAGG